MKLLAIETSVTPGSLALFESTPKQPQITSRRLPERGRTAVTLAPVLKQVLADAGWQALQLDAVAVTEGPGSFTGLRLGITTAKALAYAATCDVVPVSTLRVLAEQYFASGENTGRLWCILDAQRGELFAQSFDREGPRSEQVILSADRWLEALQPGDAAIGPVLKKFSEKLPAGVAVADEQLWQPQAETVARLAADAIEAGQTCSPFDLVPKYGRLSAAEEKADQT